MNGRSIDEPLLVAIDGDGDEFLNTSKNTTNGVNIVDAEYYYLSNRLGSISAILDADNQDRILEYYRYEVFGSATVLPIVDNNADGIEDTPLDLNDNNTAGPALVSSFGNTYLYTARRFDDITGLYYYRNRYYDPRSGRFITRDPIEYIDGPNCYVYVKNMTSTSKDAFGLRANVMGDGIRGGGLQMEVYGDDIKYLSGKCAGAEIMVRWKTFFPVSGWIIQKVTKKLSYSKCGQKSTERKKTYWEAWQVINGVVKDVSYQPQGRGFFKKITLSHEGDTFLAPGDGEGSKGKWVITGKARFFPNYILDPKQWPGVPSAGGLPSTVFEPWIWSDNKTTIDHELTYTWNCCASECKQSEEGLKSYEIAIASYSG